MSTLFKLKKWLSLEDTARHIEILSGVSVNVADVLHFGLTGMLTLSAYMIEGVYARRLDVVNPTDLEYDIFPGYFEGDPPVRIPSMGSQYLIDGAGHRYLMTTFLEDISLGVWDLSMMGGERAEIARKHRRLSGGADAGPKNLFEPIYLRKPDGDLLELLVLNTSNEDLQRWPLKEINFTAFKPALELSAHCDIVVKTSSLEEFARKLREADNSELNATPDLPMATKERNGWATTVGVLCKMAKVDYSRPAKAAGDIAHAAQLDGVRLPESSVENYLKYVPDAITSRRVS